MRGRFVRGDGLVLHNNISLMGSKMILEAAFRNTVPTFVLALVTGTPTLDMTLSGMEEPTIGVNGYSRKAITRDDTGWPTSAEAGGEWYVGTEWTPWQPEDGPFDKAIQRVALLSSLDSTDVDEPILALSAPLPNPVIIGLTTPLAQRQFKYEVFL